MKAPPPALRRTVETCPHRSDIRLSRSSKEVARCNLLQEISGVEEDSFLDASRGACDVCVRKVTPSAKIINSVIASLLYGLAGKVLKVGGVGGCDPVKAESLQLWAKKNLEVIMPDGWKQGKDAHLKMGREPCFYLGRQTGERQCESCRGSVRLKTFECVHERHGETTIQQCRQCLDFESPLTKGTVQSWSVGVITAPREHPTIDDSWRSLCDAGWPDAHLFAEPNSPLPDGIDSSKVTKRKRQLGAWPNWILALTEMILRDPHADAYLLCQDDVLYAKGLRAYLEQDLWPSSRLGVVSLHTASHQDRGNLSGFYAVVPGWSAWGAQAYVFPNASARALISNRQVINHRHRGPGDGLCNIDSVVGQWAKDSHLDYYLHSPSPTQHVGDTSTLWEGATTEGRRQASTFVGSQVDIGQWMDGTQPQV